MIFDSLAAASIARGLKDRVEGLVLVADGIQIKSEELLAPALLCHKEPARATGLCLLLAGSLWHKGVYNRTFQGIEATYPLCLMP